VLQRFAVRCTFLKCVGLKPAFTSNVCVAGVVAVFLGVLQCVVTGNTPLPQDPSGNDLVACVPWLHVQDPSLLPQDLLGMAVSRETERVRNRERTREQV